MGGREAGKKEVRKKGKKEGRDEGRKGRLVLNRAKLRLEFVEETRGRH